MRPLAIIPARRHSRRLPHKNLRTLGRDDPRSLVEIAIEQAVRLFGDNVVLSTDIQIATPTAPRVIFRDPELCRDDTPMMAVVRHCIDRVSPEFDAVVLLQPTSPLRSDDDIRACIELLERNDAVVSVTGTRMPELFTLGHAGRLRLHNMVSLRGNPFVRPNGAVFAVKTSVLDVDKDWWTADVVAGYEMPEFRSIDIDTVYDLEEASRLWEEQHREQSTERHS